MLLNLALGVAALLTIFMGISSLVGMFIWRAEDIFPNTRPLWLTLITWAYLTCALLGWFSFSQEMSPLRLLAVAMITIATLKLLFTFFSYPHFMFIGQAVWNNRYALATIMTSSLIVGGLMLFVTTLL